MRDKLVVRRLPPQLPETVFWSVIDPNWSEKLLWKLYICGKKSKNRFSRAYLQFKDGESLLGFYKTFDNHLFIDSKGNEYRCVVEFAPNQKIPKLPGKVDSRSGTIFEDSEYKAFMEQLTSMSINLEGASHDEIITFLTEISKKDEKDEIEVTNEATIDSSKKGKSTPLLEYLSSQKRPITTKSKSDSKKKSSNSIINNNGSKMTSKKKKSSNKNKK